MSVREYREIEAGERAPSSIRGRICKVFGWSRTFVS
jgi:hypothetical protein